MQDFFKFLWDNTAMLNACQAHWTLIPAAAANSAAQENSDCIDASQNGKRHTYGLRIAYPEQAKEIGSDGLVVGSCPKQSHIHLDSPQVHLLFAPCPCPTRVPSMLWWEMRSPNRSP